MKLSSGQEIQSTFNFLFLEQRLEIFLYGGRSNFREYVVVQQSRRPPKGTLTLNIS
jgi:hypothetical protein